MTQAPFARTSLLVLGISTLVSGCGWHHHAAAPELEPEPAPVVFAASTPRTGPQTGIRLFGAIPGTVHGFAPDSGQNLRRVSFAAEGADSDPAIAPDGTLLYFSSTAHRSNPDIYVKSIDGRTMTQLTNDPASDIMPAVSPDGRRIAFASDRSGSWDIYVMNATGGAPVQLTSDSEHELHPTWSPDGRTIAYSRLSDASGRWEIWTSDAVQSGVQRYLTPGLFPDWHPKENRIVFQRSRERGDRYFSVWTLDHQRGEAVNLTEVASSPSAALINPEWSSDGMYIAFAAVSNPVDAAEDSAPAFAEIWVVNANGTGLANVSGSEFANLSPTWGPGDSIYFASNRGGTNNIWAINPAPAILASDAGAAPSVRGSNASAMAPLEPAPMGSAPESHPMTEAMMDRGAAGATSAPVQTEPDARPDLANVPIDDR